MNVRVKICGLTEASDVALACESEAWALGFVFCDRSPRAISPERAREILKAAEGFRVKKVGVFVDESIDTVIAAVETSGIDTVQLHGAESPVYCKALAERLPGTALIKAFRFRSREETVRVAAYPGIEATLVDSYVPGQHGGTGIVGDWEIAKRARAHGQVILAGGLHAGNVRRAVIEIQPYAIDVSSSLEIQPGRKSPEKVKEFFSVVRSLSEVRP